MFKFQVRQLSCQEEEEAEVSCRLSEGHLSFLLDFNTQSAAEDDGDYLCVSLSAQQIDKPWKVDVDLRARHFIQAVAVENAVGEYSSKR